MPRGLFVYGTLCDAELRAALLGRAATSLRITAALLPGHRAVRSRRGPYPVLRRDPGATVAGLLIRNPSRARLAQLAAYEGTEYRLAAVRVETADGRVAALAFLPRSPAAGGGAWDFAAWRRRDKPRLLGPLLRRAGSPLSRRARR